MDGKTLSSAEADGDAVPEDPTPTPPESTRPPWVFFCLVTALLIVLTVRWWRLTTTRPAPLPWQRSDRFAQLFQVDINQATWVEWLQLEGIGETLAHRIVADRELRGDFQSVEDLQRVDGIGPATLDRIRPHLTMGHDLSRKPQPVTGNASSGQ